MSGLTEEGEKLIEQRDKGINIYKMTKDQAREAKQSINKHTVKRITVRLYEHNERDLYDLLAAGFAENKQDAIRRAIAESASRIRTYRHR